MSAQRLIRSTKRGFRSVAVIAWPNGSYTRADVPAELALKMSRKQAAKALGMTVQELVEASKA